MRHKKTILIFAFLLTGLVLVFGLTVQTAKAITDTSGGEINRIKQLTTQLNQTQKSFLAARTTKEKSEKLINLENIAKERKLFVQELMKKNPRAFLSIALPQKQRSAFPKSIQKHIEEETAITAKIEVLHIDDFEKPKNSRYEYFLMIDKARFNFYLTLDLNIRSDTRIKLKKAFRLENFAVADINKTNFQILAEPPLDSVGEQKTIVFLIKRPDEQPLFSREQAHNLIFNSQFQNFMKEQSYNQVSFSGDVYGWINLAQAGCNNPWITDPAIIQFITDNNINLANYHRVLFLINFYGGGCSYVGRYNITIDGNTYRLSETWVGGIDFSQPSGWGQQPFQWTNLDFVLAHELGHALGVNHANGWDCDSQVLYGDNCQHLEYGNLFDTMGYGNYSLDFNAIFKEILGWIKPNRSLLITQSGRYTINPLELDSGINIAKIRSSDQTTPFYLEYRKGIGFDSKLNNPELLSNQDGLFVNTNTIGIAQWGAGLPNTSHLLDMSPISSDWWGDIEQTTLNSTSVFRDPGNGITIGPIVSATASSITFDVNIGAPTCLRQKPYITCPSFYCPNLSDKVVAGAEGWISFSFSNRDSSFCGQSEFQINLILPPALKYSSEYPSGNIPLLPQKNGWKNIYFSVPVNTATGQYKIGYEIVNLNSGLSLKKTGEFTVTVVEPPVISRINPLSGPIGTKVVLSGSGFDLKENIIYFRSDAGWKYFYGIPSSDGKTLEFEIPATIESYYGAGGGVGVGVGKAAGGGGGSSQIPTPTGIYEISVIANNAMSNAVNFEVILPPASIKILSPNGGEKWEIGSTQTIKWSGQGLPSDSSGLVSVEAVKWFAGKKPVGTPAALASGLTAKYTLTLKNTKTKTEIPIVPADSALPLTQTEYSWKIPEALALDDNYLVYVEATVFYQNKPVGKIVSDESDKVFSIVKEPLAYFKFEGDIKDSSENKNNGISPAGREPSFVAGPIGQAAQFDSSQKDYVYVSDRPSLNFGKGDYSIAAWVKFPLSGTSSWEGIVSKGYTTSAPAGSWGLIKDSGSTNRIAFSDAATAGKPNVNLRLTSDIPDGWRHIAYVRAGESNKLYVDGQLKLTQIKPIADLNNTANLLIGQANNRYFSGAIDDLMIYGKALGGKEIAELYDMGQIPSFPITLEAEEGQIVVPMKVSQTFIWVPYVKGEPAKTGGKANFNFKAPAGETIYVWGRVYAPNTASDSFCVQVNNQPGTSCYAGLPGYAWPLNASNAWHWERIQQGFKLNQETSHTLIIGQREYNTRLDKIVITNNPDYLPPGVSPTPTPSPRPSPSPSPSPTPIFSISLEAEIGSIQSPMKTDSDSTASGGKFVWVPWSKGEPAKTGGQVKFNFSATTSSAVYVWARTIAPNTASDSFYLSIDGSADYSWSVPISTSWKWNKVAAYDQAGAKKTSFILGRETSHGLVVKQREYNVKLDKLVITSDPNYNPNKSSFLNNFINGAASMVNAIGRLFGK